MAADVVLAVEKWLDEDDMRRDIRWQENSDRPLKWAWDPSQMWTVSRLAKRIIALATNGPDPDSIGGGDVWRYEGKTLASIASDFLDSDRVATDDI